MARNSVEMTINDRGNDLRFRITEMPAIRLESWITRALLLLGGAGAELMENPDLTMAGRYPSTHGLSALAGVDYARAKPLLDELLSCCSRLVEGVETRCTPENADDYIQDVTTLFKLRMEALKLNLGFLKGGREKLSVSPEKANTAER